MKWKIGDKFTCTHEDYIVYTIYTSSVLHGSDVFTGRSYNYHTRRYHNNFGPQQSYTHWKKVYRPIHLRKQRQIPKKLGRFVNL